MDFDPDLPSLTISLVSQDGRARFSYSIFGLRCFAGGDTAETGNNPGLVSDCEALLAAKDTLAGTSLLNWSERTPIVEWTGVTLAGSPLRVTGLDLSERGLTGNLPPVLGSLTNLQSPRQLADDGYL